MNRLFKETPTFTKKIESIGEESLLRTIQDAILEDQSVGNTIAGTGGMKKFRLSDPSRGKGKAEDLTPDEKKVLKALVKVIKGEQK